MVSSPVPSVKPRRKGVSNTPMPTSDSSVTGAPRPGIAGRSSRRPSQPKQRVVIATLSTTPGSDLASFTPALVIARNSKKRFSLAGPYLEPGFTRPELASPLLKPLEAPCSVAGITAFWIGLCPCHPFQHLRKKFPDEPCTFEFGEYGEVGKFSAGSRCSHVASVSTQKADLGLVLYERTGVENYLRRLASEINEDHPRYVANLKAWREYNKTRNALADRLRWQMPRKVWEWCVETYHEPRRCPAERLLEPTYLQ
ncbi:hypothetical protein PHMEG_00013469 [Phytophthora megakarya]|uniref:Uncharacterized protein n=1 Tax=Phytophthora megakarya TaxID=4795 RepID=A0A225W677_9STRA|nr:hypothetical protein PHMEG_00013469 [Phytophthora megakarya]